MPAGEPMDEGTMNSSRFMKSAEAEAEAARLRTGDGTATGGTRRRDGDEDDDDEDEYGDMGISDSELAELDV